MSYTPGQDQKAAKLLEVVDLKVHFPDTRVSPWLVKSLRAVDGVSFTCAKAKRWVSSANPAAENPPWRGRFCSFCRAPPARWSGWAAISMFTAGRRCANSGKELQIVFQDPLASLDPRMTIGQSIGEPLRALMPQLTREEVASRVGKIMARVGLEPAWINRYPHEFSSRPNQRVGVARAMIIEPKLVICDEV